MSIGFSSNILALRLGRSLETNSARAASSSQRLSSGMRINKGADDAAGLAISNSLNAQTRIYGQSIRDVNDAIGRLNVASSTVSGLTDIVARLSELAEQASNAPVSGKQRVVINKEASALVAEYNRIVLSTQSQGVSVLDGTDDNFTIRAGMSAGSSTQVQVGQEMGYAAGDGTVGAASTLANGGLPYDVATADLNGDGNVDIVSSDYGANSVGVYLGTGNGTFGSESRYSAGAINNQVWDVATGDFNRDGRIDIATANRDGTMGVLLGNGNGTLQTAQTYASATDTLGVATADINNDGVLDIVTNGSGTGIDAYVGKGDGTFTRRTISSGATGGRVAAGDLNNDGNQDLVVSSGIFYGNGDGTFKAITALPGSSFTITSAAVTDLNKDGMNDLVTATSNSVDGTVSVYMGTSSGSLASPVHYAHLNYSSGVVATDVNGDGNQDIAISGSGGLRIFTGNGDGTLNSAVAYAGVGFSLATADFNKDGVSDFAVSQYANGSVGVLTFLGNADASGRRKNIIDPLDLSSIPSARAAVDWCRTHIEKLSREVGMLGAYQSRLETQVSSLYSTRLASTEASARITDADIAQEASAGASAGIAQSSSAALLAQANLQPQVALTVLKSEFTRK